MTARCVSTRFGRVLVNPGRMSRPSAATKPSANFQLSLEWDSRLSTVPSDRIWEHILDLSPESRRAYAVEGACVRVGVWSWFGKAQCIEEQVHYHFLEEVIIIITLKISYGIS